MKTLLIALAAALCVAQSALAAPTITVTASPSSQGPVAIGDTFNVTFSLTVTPDSTTGKPANFAGFDLYIATAAANSGFFSIVNTTSPIFSGSGPSEPVGGDPIATADSNPSFVRNGVDQGWTSNGSQDVNTPFSNLAFATVTFRVNAGTPAATYTLLSTSQSQDNVFFSDMTDNAGTASANYPFQNSASFQVTVAAVPEPAVWSLMGLGGLGAFGLNVLRRRSR
jgi:PEP-CTERM motif